MKTKLLAVLVLALHPESNVFSWTQGPATLPHWMTGCWAGDIRGAQVHERWFAAGNALVGLSTTVTGSTLREFEFLRIAPQGSGIAYLAQPGGRPATAFTASTASASEVVFENPQHAFPKRVGYRRSGTELLAWIDGGSGAESKRQEYPLRSVPCEK